MARKPTISATVVDVNSKTIALTGDSSVLIRHWSDARATMTPTAYDGAAIDLDMCIIRNGANTGYGTEHTFYAVETNDFRFSVQDSNGVVGTASVVTSMIPYVTLTCDISNNKPDADGDMTVRCSGGYYNGSFGRYANTLTVQYRYGEKGTTLGSWINMAVVEGDTTYYALDVLHGLDYKTIYEFEFRATDRLMTVESSAVVNSMPVFHWSGSDFQFEVPVDFNGGIRYVEFLNDVYISKNLILQGNGTYGSYLKFGDGNYCYIAEKSDDAMTIYARESINLNTPQLYHQGEPLPIPETGTWTPELDGGAVRSYSRQEGWYIKSGNVVTVGWYIKARAYEGYEDIDIAIYGLPYSPAISASGGGICSLTYVPPGYLFQCFVAEAGTYEITARVQSYNDSYWSELVTSASGCGYPSDGSQFTLSGTITYMTYD